MTRDNAIDCILLPILIYSVRDTLYKSSSCMHLFFSINIVGLIIQLVYIKFFLACSVTCCPCNILPNLLFGVLIISRFLQFVCFLTVLLVLFFNGSYFSVRLCIPFLILFVFLLTLFPIFDCLDEPILNRCFIIINVEGAVYASACVFLSFPWYSSNDMSVYFFFSIVFYNTPFFLSLRLSMYLCSFFSRLTHMLAFPFCSYLDYLLPSLLICGCIASFILCFPNFCIYFFHLWSSACLLKIEPTSKNHFC